MHNFYACKMKEIITIDTFKFFTEIRKSNLHKNLIEYILIQIIKINTNTINSKNYWTYGQGHKCGEADILLL